MKHIFLFFSLVAVLLLSSCATTNFISLDVLTPATVTLSSKAESQNIIIVDNAPDWNSIGDYGEPFTAAVMDTAKAALLYSLVNFMNEEQYFNNVDIYPYKMFDPTQSDSVRLLSKEKVKDICLETSADALISLDEFLMVGALEEDYGGNVLELKIGLALRVFSPITGEMVQPLLVHTDSLYWTNIKYSKGKENPEVDNAMKEISVITADKLVNTFIPGWSKQNRWYYVDGTAPMKEAAKHAKEDKWKEASAVWEEAFASIVDVPQKAKVASNIALAYEAMDDIPNAMAWITTAFDLLPLKSGSDYALQIVVYKGVLESRLEATSKLKEQYGED